MWVRESITDGEIDALQKAAQLAWTEETKYPRILASNRDSGQCYVTARWLVDRLGGKVGRKGGHYAWLSGDESFYLDLTGHHTGKVQYAENDGFVAVDPVDNGRTELFAKRANRAFDNLNKLMKIGIDYMGDFYAPQEKTIDDEQYLHDEPSIKPKDSETKRFIMANGDLIVSDDAHEEILRQIGLDQDYAGPMAIGFVKVDRDQAVWQVQTNIDLKTFSKAAREYSQHVGWRYAGTSDIEGGELPAFAQREAKTIRFVVSEDGYLTMGRTSHADLALQAGSDNLEFGTLKIAGYRAVMEPIVPRAVEATYEWATDNGLTLYGYKMPGSGEDLSANNVGADDGRIEKTEDEKNLKQITDEVSGMYRCPACGELFPSWAEYQVHRKDEEGDAEQITKSFPDNDMDATFPPHFTEQPPRISPVAKSEAQRVHGFRGGSEADDYYVAYHCGSPIAYARIHEGRLAHMHLAKEKDGWADHFLTGILKFAGQEPKDLLPDPVPFIFDVGEYHIHTGNPGERTSDIRGDFTKGGIVEGIYEPGGKMIVRDGTNMPYTIYGMVKLWYHTHPELTVTGVEMRDEEGGTSKLAAEEEEDESAERLKNIGGYICGLVAADPVAYESAVKLREAGGEVYAVGGAVRDAVLGKEPKDIDLMVTKLGPEEVNGALSELDGRVDLTGKDFGVFRYKNGDGEVEIALPRTEQSTGGGHQDFDVQADPNLSVEDDLWRRDFTVNAMAVDLSNGKLIDPYEGFRDALNGNLRVVNPEALSEDPLRIIRGLVSNARHGLTPTTDTMESMRANAEGLKHLPPERIHPELDKILTSNNPSAAIRLAQESGVLNHFLPEVAAAFGYNQNNPHHEQGLGDHLLNVLERVTEKTDDPDVRFAALLHDIGKPNSAWVDPETGSNHYYQKELDDGTILGANHEEVGAEMVRELMNRLRYPNDRIDRVSELVNHHMYGAFETPKGARKFINRVGDHADDLLNLRWADQGGKTAYPTSDIYSLDKEAELLAQVREQQAPTAVSQLAVNGNDLINELGMNPGPAIGQTLEELVQRVIDDPSLNERETLLSIANPMAL
jgi:tRNA nucleotidyltransferase (CCA-adding enzyme)